MELICNSFGCDENYLKNPSNIKLLSCSSDYSNFQRANVVTPELIKVMDHFNMASV